MTLNIFLLSLCKIDCHYKKKMNLFVFWVWPISLSNVLSSSIYFIADAKISFILG